MLFKGFCLVRTYVIVIHGNIVSQYHILKKDKNWVKHIKLDHVIKEVFRLVINVSENLKTKDFDLCLLLANSEIRYLKLGIEQPPAAPNGTRPPPVEIY